MPTRVQRKRTKGFKLPENTVCVDRTTKWGNPFKVVEEDGRYHVKDREGNYWGERPYMSEIFAIGVAIDLYKNWLEGQILIKKLDPQELRGKNLACFCSLDKPCHAGYLLEIANEDYMERSSDRSDFKYYDKEYKQKAPKSNE